MLIRNILPSIFIYFIIDINKYILYNNNIYHFNYLYDLIYGFNIQIYFHHNCFCYGNHKHNICYINSMLKFKFSAQIHLYISLYFYSNKHSNIHSNKYILRK